MSDSVVVALIYGGVILTIVVGICWLIWILNAESFNLAKAKNRQAVDDFYQKVRERREALVGKAK